MITNGGENEQSKLYPAVEMVSITNQNELQSHRLKVYFWLQVMRLTNVWAHKTSLTPPLLIVVPGPSCRFAASVTMIFQFDFGTVLTVCYFFQAFYWLLKYIFHNQSFRFLIE